MVAVACAVAIAIAAMSIALVALRSDDTTPAQRAVAGAPIAGTSPECLFNGDCNPVASPVAVPAAANAAVPGTSPECLFNGDCSHVAVTRFVVSSPVCPVHGRC